MGETTIEWTDVTWNPTRGCSRVSEGCRHCYAERIAGRFSGKGQEFEGYAEGAPQDYHGQSGRARTNGSWRWTGKVDLIPSKLGEPLHWRKPRRVFVNSMSDLFHERLSMVAIDAVFAVMALARRHTFQVLTKRPERMLKYVATTMRQRFIERVGRASTGAINLQFTWPLPNVWLGVSVEDQGTADKRIPLLLQTPAQRRFVSYEPALGPVDFARWAGQLDWIIVGGESGPSSRPFQVAWARETIRQCRQAGPWCFVKQLGARPYLAEGDRLLLKSAKGGDMAEWPEDLRVREWPPWDGPA